MVELNFSDGQSKLLTPDTEKQMLQDAGSPDGKRSSKDLESFLARVSPFVQTPAYDSDSFLCTPRDIALGTYTSDSWNLLHSLYNIPDNQLLMIGSDDLESTVYRAARDRNTNQDTFLQVDSSDTHRRLTGLSSGRWSKQDLVTYKVSVADMFYTALAAYSGDGVLLGYHWNDQGVEFSQAVLAAALRVLQNHAGFDVGIRRLEETLADDNSSESEKRLARYGIRRYQRDKELYDSQLLLDELEQNNIDPDELTIRSPGTIQFSARSLPYTRLDQTPRLTKLTFSVPARRDLARRHSVSLFNYPAVDREFSDACYSLQYSMHFVAGIESVVHQGNDSRSSKKYYHWPAEAIAAAHSAQTLLTRAGRLRVRSPTGDKRPSSWKYEPNNLATIDLPFVIPTAKTMKLFDKAYQNLLVHSHDSRTGVHKLRRPTLRDISVILGEWTKMNKNNPSNAWVFNADQLPREEHPMYTAIQF